MPMAMAAVPWTHGLLKRFDQNVSAGNIVIIFRVFLKRMMERSFRPLSNKTDKKSLKVQQPSLTFFGGLVRLRDLYGKTTTAFEISQ